MEATAEDIRTAFAQVIRLMVDHPDLIEVSLVDDSVLRIKVDKSDHGKVIGISGRTARAMRTLLAATCRPRGVQLSLDLLPIE